MGVTGQRGGMLLRPAGWVAHSGPPHQAVTRCPPPGPRSGCPVGPPTVPLISWGSAVPTPPLRGHVRGSPGRDLGHGRPHRPPGMVSGSRGDRALGWAGVCRGTHPRVKNVGISRWEGQGHSPGLHGSKAGSSEERAARLGPEAPQHQSEGPPTPVPTAGLSGAQSWGASPRTAPLTRTLAHTHAHTPA